MNYLLLGPMAVLRDGEALSLGGLRQRAVLAALLLSADRTVDVDKLTDLVWDDAAPPKPISSLRAYIANLRRILGSGTDEHGQRLVTDAGGYRLQLGSDRVDTRDFESLAANGKRLLDTGDEAGSSRVLQRALQLWRGTPLSDFRDQPFVHHEVHRLEALRADAVELRFEAELRLGRAAEVVADLETEIVNNPMRERLWAQLMLAMYRAGRRTDALRAYGRVQLVLHQELGVRPGLALERLAADIRGESAELDWQSPHHGAIHRLPRGQPNTVRHDGLLGGLFGRSRELERVRAAMSSASDGRGSVTVLSGDSGVGKTALAAEIADIASDLGMATVWAGHSAGSREQPSSAWNQVFRELAGQTADLRSNGEQINPDGVDTIQATANAVARLATRWPALIVLDDLHRADPFTHDVLEILCATIHRVPMLILATWQDGGVDRPLRVQDFDRLLSRSDIVTIKLRGIGPDATADLIERVSGVAPTADLVAAVGGRTGGNPFYIRELTRLLQDKGHLDETTREIDGADVPDAVSGVIRRRMADLPEATRTALTAAAVLGNEFGATRLAAALANTSVEVAAHLDSALEAGMVGEVPDQPGYYRFSHGLVRDAVAAQLSGVARAKMHAEIARGYASEAGQVASEDSFGGADHAWRAGSELAPDIALGLLDRALAEAWARSAYQQIADLDRRALDICTRLPADSTRLRKETDLLLQLASVEAVVNGQSSPDVLDSLRRVSEIASDTESFITATAMRGIEACSAARYREAAVHSDGLITAYAKTGDPLAGSAGYYIRAVADFARGDLDRCLEAIATLQTELPTLDPERYGPLATFNVLSYGVAVWAYSVRGDETRAQEQLSSGIALGIARHDTFGTATVRTSAVQRYGITGESTGAAQRADDMLAELTSFEIDQFAPGARIISGWARAIGPGGVDTTDDVRVALAKHSEGGRRIFSPLYLALLSDIEAIHRSSDQARSTLHEAEMMAMATGERVWDAHLSTRRRKLRSERYRPRSAAGELRT